MYKSVSQAEKDFDREYIYSLAKDQYKSSFDKAYYDLQVAQYREKYHENPYQTSSSTCDTVTTIILILIGLAFLPYALVIGFFYLVYKSFT